MSHRALLLLVVTTAVFLCAAAIPPLSGSAAPELSSPLLHCTKKHGKRHCSRRKPAPTPTATATPQPDLFSAPAGIAVDTAGNVYVADAERDHILKLSPDGHLLNTIGREGNGPGQFEQPWGVAIDHDGNIYVTEAWGMHYPEFREHLRRIQKLSPDGSQMAQFTNTALGLLLPCGVTVSDAGDIFITDHFGGSVLHMRSDGSLVGRFNTVDPNPCGIAIDREGNLFISQANDETVGKYDSAGNRIATLGTPDGVDPPFGVALDEGGNIYAVNMAHDKVRKFDATGKLVTSWGSSGSGPGQFALREQYLLGIAADRSGNVYVSDPSNHRVEKFSAAGSLLAVWR